MYQEKNSNSLRNMEGQNKASKIIWYYSNRSFFMTERKGKYSLKFYRLLFLKTENQKGNTRKGKETTLVGT